ncbi:MAG: phosphotransferase [Phycicoccus sp.]
MTRLTPEAADRLARGLAGICEDAGVPVHGPRLVKFTINAVYHVGDVAVRLAHGPTARLRGERLVTTMASLTAAGAPVIPLATGIRQPVTYDGWTATIWPWLPTLDSVPRPVDLAGPLRAFHDATAIPPSSAGSATAPADSRADWRPTTKCLDRIEATRQLPDREYVWTDTWAKRETGESLPTVLEWLQNWAEDLATRLDHGPWSLPPGLVHGDAHTGNLLHTTDGRALFCDLDGVRLGPREWDLVPTAHGSIRFGRSPSEYQAFAEAYGLDITRTAGWSLLRETRDLQLATSVLAELTGRPTTARQLGHRLRTLQRHDITATWTRYT